MRSPSKRGWIIGVLCAVLALLSGCSAVRLGYDQGPRLSYWWLDGYADFDDEQSAKVHAALDDWFRWHRHDQLPEYAALLVRAQTEVRSDATPAEACAWVSEARQRMMTGFEVALPAITEVAMSLKPEQLQHIERRYAKANDEFRDDYLQDSVESRRKASLKRTLERAEMLYGSMDKSQRERIVQALAISPFDPDLWMAERRARQQDVLDTLRQLSSGDISHDQAQQALRALVDRINHSPREAWVTYEQRLLTYNCAFVADLHNSTSASQREAAIKRLQGWEADARALAAEAR